MGEFHRGAWAYPLKRQSGEDLHSPVAFVRRALVSAMKLEDDEIHREVESLVEIRTKEGQMEEDSPIHFHIWDRMFLRSWANFVSRVRRFSMVESCNDPRGCITIQPLLMLRIVNTRSVCINAQDR